jgi:hypothetical protein
MVGRSVDKKDKIRAYNKEHSKLGCSLKQLMTELSTAFGPSCVSYDTVRRWKKKFESGVECIKNAPKMHHRHITINGSLYFEEAFESQKNFC